MNRLEVLQAVRLKGRMAPELLAAITAIPPAQTQPLLSAEIEAGTIVQPKPEGPVRITPEGRELLAKLLAEERSGLDHDRLHAAYETFDAPNRRLKAVVGAWQMKDEATPNDHTDSEYDAGVIAQLREVHREAGPMLQTVVALVPRLAPYSARLEDALGKVLAGDTAFIARPTVDSYHQVWFELHEELMDCLGLTRAEETAAGRA